MMREEAVRRIDQAAEEKLTELYLLGLDLEELPGEIGKCTQLEKLVLGKFYEGERKWVGNKLIEFPHAVLELTNLKILNLTGNSITSIPESVGKMSNLTELNLRGNQITSIPQAIGQLSNLQALFLHDNQITSIPEAIGQLSNLEYVFLNNNQITSIPEAIGQLSKLMCLNLRNNQITEIPEVICSIKNLEHLFLQGNPLLIPLQVLRDGQNYEGREEWRIMLDSYFYIRNATLPDLDAERQKIESEGYFDAETLQDARRRITASIVQRQGQPKFRRELLTAYGGRCPITDCDVESAIEAAHIIPYQGTQTNYLTNGLPLRADIHTLFDLHLLSIRPYTNEVVITPELVGTCYQDLVGRKLALPHDPKAAPNQSALSKHYETFLSKSKISQLNVYNP